MRVGHNPARYIEKVAQPAEITVAVVNCIPFLSGYFEQGLEVLKTVVDSLHAAREPEHPYDVLVFDNHSCDEAREYLKEANDQGKIQYLVLSDTNIGKIGAWNYMFGAAQGNYIVFSDGDVAFRPGWLSASLAIFNTFPDVGMVTARPLPTPMEFSTATLEWAKNQAPDVLEVGRFLSWDVFWEHACSLGMEYDDKHSDIASIDMHRLTYGGQRAYVGAAHFQFMARADVLRKVIPLPSEQPMRGERELDIKINKMGYLRLTTPEPYVVHMGNRVSLPVATAQKRTKISLRKLFWLPGIRHILLWLHNQIFKLYFLDTK
jgi:GT2 family glycosyltransferase